MRTYGPNDGKTRAGEQLPGFSPPEIADIMELPMVTAKTQVLRGRQEQQELPGDWQEGSGDEW